jgi:hemerythrin-like metal-binding protein
MDLITWEDKLSVNIHDMDQEHQQLIGLINELHNAMRQGQGKLVISSTLENLIQYTQTHFGHEEQLMQEIGYPDLIDHKKEHTALTKQVIDLQTRHDQGERVLTIEIMQFLKNWLTHHILNTDKKYGEFAQRKN